MLELLVIACLGWLAWRDHAEMQVGENDLLFFGFLCLLAFFEWLAGYAGGNMMEAGLVFTFLQVLTVFVSLLLLKIGFWGEADAMIAPALVLALNWWAFLAFFLMLVVYAASAIVRGLFARFGGNIAFIPYMFAGSLLALVARLHFVK